MEVSLDSQKTLDYERKEKQVMAEMGVKVRVDVPLDTEEQLTYDATKEIYVRIDKKEILMTQQMIVMSPLLILIGNFQLLRTKPKVFVATVVLFRWYRQKEERSDHSAADFTLLGRKRAECCCTSPLSTVWNNGKSWSRWSHFWGTYTCTRELCLVLAVRNPGLHV